MSGDNFDRLYNALKADGAIQGTREEFRKRVTAPGKQGYQNRKMLYDALHADGAIQSATYEEWAKKIGLHAVTPAATPTNTPRKPMTAMEMQRRVAQEAAQKAKAKPQQAQGTPDYMKQWNLLTKPASQMTPLERSQAEAARYRMQNATRQSFKQKMKQAASSPIMRSRADTQNPMRNANPQPYANLGLDMDETMVELSGPEAQRARAIQQHKDDAMAMAGGNVNDNSGVSSQIDSVVDASMKEASDAAKEKYAKNLDEMGAFASQYERDQAFKGAQDLEQKLRQETITKNLSLKLQEIYSDKKLQSQIVQSADKMNMGIEEYVDKFVTPQIMNRAQQVLWVKNLEEIMPGGTMGYIAKNLSNSILGTLVAPSVMSRSTRQRMQEGLAISEGLQEMPQVKGHKDNTYRAGAGARFLSTATNMAMDSAPLSVIGGVANLGVDLGKRILTTGLARVGLIKGGAKLTAQQLGFKIANMTMAQKIGSGLLEGSARGALNLGGYSGITAALGQASTGDDTSLAAIAQAGLEGAKHGAVTGSMFGATGAVMAPWIQKFGINGTETTKGQRWLHGAQKAGATALGLGVEAGTMMVADNVTGDKEISVGQWLEDVVMVGAFKAGEPSNYGKIGQALYGLTHNTNNTFRFGKDSDGNWRQVDIRLTDSEKNELMNSTSGKSLMDAFGKVDKSNLNSKDNIDKNITKLAYQEFMADPNVSQSTKEKVNAAMGLFNTTHKRSYRSVNDVQNKEVLEYAQDGTLLTRTSYKNAEERRNILFRQKAYRDNEDLLSLVGYAKMKDSQYLDKDGRITDNAVAFLQAHGYDLSKEPTDSENAKIISNMQDENSELRYLWNENRSLVGVFASDSAKKAVEILKKDPMRRTDEEVQKIRQFKTELDAYCFPDGEAHPEQSQMQGRSIAEEEGLGSDNPNPVPVVTELQNLSAAEDALQELMDSNDVFKETYESIKKQGLTNPQIYDAMIQQNGLTEEQLEPFARYLNANARVQGMQQATQEAIEQRVESVAGDWGFHGTMDGQQADGSQMLYVKDNNGRTLIVGSGDVAYDPTTGRAKDGVGDMLVCLDTQTREPVYVKVEDTTLDQTQNVEDFKNEERQRLQMINSAPYNQAAQEQAMKDASKPQPKEEEVSQQQETIANDTQTEQPKPIGKSLFGNVYDAFRGKAKEAFNYLFTHKEGDLQGVYHRKDVGDIDLVWGDRTKNQGLDHIIDKHIEKNNDFDSLEEAAQVIDDVINNGEVNEKKSKWDKVVLEKDGYMVIISKNVRDKDGNVIDSNKNWVVTAFDSERGKGNKKRNPSDVTLVTPNTNEGSRAVAPDGSPFTGKDTNNSSNGNENNTSLTFEDGSPVPMVKDSKGRLTPDYGNMKPEQAAEILTKQFGESAEKVVGGQIKKAEKAVKDAEKMKVNYEGELNDILEQEELKRKTVSEAQKQLEHAQSIKKAMTVKKVAETVSKEEKPTEGANQAGSVASQKFQGAPRLVGNKRSRTLPNNEKIKGHYEIVPAESLTPSHDATNGYKKSEGFPVDAEGRTTNDRDYENEKAAQQSTDQIALKYNGQAIEQVPVVSDEGIVYDGNGRTMAGQKAAKEGTDGEYISELLDNAENFGFTREQIEKSGIEHPRLVLVTDERMPYTTETFAKFNRNEKKAQNNTEQAVAKSKTLSPEDVGAIVSEIEGNGSLEAFFNNPNAISSLWKTLQEKGIIGQNEVAGLQDMPGVPNAQGKEFVKNLVLGAMFKPETIRMMGVDSAIKNKVVNGIRAIMDNSKLGDYALGDEVEGAIRLLYEARTNKMKVGDLLRSSDFVQGNARDRFSEISQALAQALEEKATVFRDLMSEYNNVVKNHNTGEGTLGFAETLDKEALVKEFLKTSETIKQNNIKLYGEEGRNSEQKDVDVPTGNEERPEEAGGRTGEEKPAESQQRVDSFKHILNRYDDSPSLHMDEAKEVVGWVKDNYSYVKGAYDVWQTAKSNRKSILKSDPNFLKESREIRGKEKDFESAVERMLNDLGGGLLGSDRRNAIEVVKIALGIDSISAPVAKSEPVTIATEHGGEKAFSSEQVDMAKKIIAENPEKPITQLQRKLRIGYEAATALAKALGWQEKPTFMPKEQKPTNPIEKAAEDYKKEHPLADEEVTSTTVFDDLPEDQKQYCIDAALDYLHGEDTSAIAEAYYRNIYEKRGKNIPQTDKKDTTSAEKDTTRTTPMEALKKAASEYSEPKTEAKIEPKKQTRKELEAERDAADNEFDAFMKELRKKRMGQANSGFIDQNLIEAAPKMFSLAAKCAYSRIKLGMYDAKEVVKDLQKRFKEAFDGFDKKDVELFYSQIMSQKWRDGDKRMSLTDWAEYYRKLSPEHQDKLVGDSKAAEERKQKENSFVSNLKMIMGSRKVNGIRELRQLAKELGLEDVKDTDLQELAETAAVSRARDIASSKAMSPERKFAEIRKLYENQPSLNQRDSDRVEKQQYSTPAPYAYLANMYVKGNGKEIEGALEPSAGNGMLTIGLPMDKVHVNDIDEARLLNLHRQGFKNITSQDGTQPFADKDVDVVVTNPPFGTATPKEYDGYKISSLEGQMAINALDSMKDDGRAAIIIGGKTEYAKNGSLNPKDKAFLGYLYSHYNVEDVINVDGSLYAKQGTTYPTRIILIDGRRAYDPESKVYPPIQKEARAEAVKDYDELYKRINDDILRKRGVQEESVGLSNGERSVDNAHGGVGYTKQGSDGTPNNKEHGTRTESGVSDLGAVGRDAGYLGEAGRSSSRHLGDKTELEGEGRADPETDRGLSRAGSGLDNGGRVSEGSASGNSNETSNKGGTRGDRVDVGEYGRSSSSVRQPSSSREGNGLEVKKETPKRELNTEKVKYVSQSSNPFSLNSVIPADQAKVTKKALDKIGDVDEFLVSELGYNDKEDMYHALGSEQADSVALAIHQAKQGNAFIIGDMTGIGKGRQAAAMIRYAYKSGKIPVFITAKKDLFSDMYRDLKSIGNAELRPFIWAAKDKDNSADMLDSEGNLVYKRTPDAEQKKVMAYLKKYGKLPEGYDYIVTTYDSFTGGTMDYENGKKTARKDGKGSKNGQEKRDLLEAIAKNANVIMDESHKAGGNGGGSSYLQYIVPKLNAITFLSATYAKRPENMPIYALRTSMNQAGVEPAELIDAIKRGGTTLQEIMSQSLAASGQFIRRERDMTGVTIDWKAIEDPVVIQEQREQYDKIIGLFNDIIDFQRTYVNSYIDQRNEDISKTQGSIKNKQGTADLGIKNTPFASRTYNMVQQVLLSLKAREAAKSAVEHLKNGEKVVIALNNTNESQTGEYAEGVEMEAPDLGVVLKKGLNGVLRYEQSDDMDNKTYGYFDVEELGSEAAARYREIEDNINNASTGLSLSPIDVIRDELEDAGYKVGELTGRTYQLARNPNGTVSKVKRTNTDKKKLALDFNTDKLDVLILNRSASTGISLHDSKDFNVKEHKPRTMIVVQQQADVNEEVQMRGRIDRTGQVNRGRYEYIVSQIPSEQRLLMMFKSKLRSLDANTTSSQKSKFNDMEVNDIINKYGDKVVKEYMADHLDLYAKMADPFGWEKAFGADLSTIDTQKLIGTSDGKVGDKEAGADASKLLGRMALLKVAEQEKMLQEIGELYKNEINRLNEMGENDLEITELPLKAKTIGKEVWKEGSEPNGDNAFADNTYIEKVNMAILKKPMKGEEVKKAQEGLTGGRSWDEYKEEKKTVLKEYFVKKFNDEKVRLDERAKKIAQKAADKYNKEAKKNQEKNQLTDEQIEKNTQFQYDNVYKDEKAKADTALKNIKTKYQAFDRVLETFNTNEAYVLPTDMNNPNEMSAFGNSYGRLIDIKITDNYSPTASTISFATLDGRRKITFPIHGLVGSGDKKVDVISTIYRLTKQAEAMDDNNYRVVNKSIDNWDRMISNESRKDGYIITGNLMQALIDTKAQGLGGQLVKYTTDNGEVKTGILMPDRFKPTDAATEKAISSKADDFMSGKTTDIMSSDGDVRLISVSNWKGTTIELRVPKSKAKGGKYYLDEKLRSLVDGNDFYTKGGSMVANLQPENVRSALDRLSALGVKVREERKEGTHFRTERENSSTGTIVSDHVSKILDKVGGNVNVVNSPEEVINPVVKERLDKGENVTGWYDEKTGEVHLYMPNIHDRYTAEKTIWHEVVGHKGMRGLFGDKFNDFLRSIYYDLDKPENAELKKLVDEERKYNPLNIYDSIEEGIARLAEDGKGEVGFWNTIKNKVTDLLHEIGYRIAPNTKDVKYLLWLSKNLQKSPNSVYWKLKANAVRERLNREKPSVTDSEGMFFGDGKTRDLENMPKKEYQEATDGQIHFRTTPSAATAIDRYHRALSAHVYMFTESYMDNMLALKNLMQAIRPDNKKIEDIKSSENPYILQNTLQGAMSNEADMFERNIMKPLSKAMAGVLDAFEGAKDEDKIKNFNLYMIKKHGLERNRVFYVRDHINKLNRKEETKQDATNLQNDWNTLKKDLGDQLRRNAIRLDEYYNKMDEWIRNNIDQKFNPGDNDYSGFHGIYEIDKADAYDDAAVIAEVMDSEANMESVKRGSVADFWNKVNTATQYSLDSDYKNGLVTKDNHDNVSVMFDWYVPLRKFDETTAEEVYGYVTEKGDPSSFIGPALMKAKGRKSLSETNILAQIGAIGNLSISRGGKNAIKQAFARFVRNNGGQGLVSEMNTWVELDGYDTNNKPIWKEALPQIPEDATPDEVAKIVSDFESDMQAKKTKGEALNITNRGRIGFKFERAKDKSQHIVDVMIAGKKHSFVINGNPRAAQALNGLLENSKAKGVMKPLGAISRFMAQTCTSYNPEFVVRNIVRDAEFALANISAKEDTRYRRLFEKYYAGLIPAGGAKSLSINDFSGSAGVGLFAKYRNGTLDTSNKIERYFKEFMENGGETGWVQIKSMKDWEKEYKQDVATERSDVRKNGKMLHDFFFGNLERLNEVAENQARFAVFCASRDYGRTAVRSAYDAKEVSVNFNRHGSGDAINSFKNGELGTAKNIEKKTIGFTSSYLRHCSMFFNAGIQSTNLLLKNIKTNPKKTIGIMASAPFALGALAALLNNCLIASEDEKDRKGVKDPYGELPDYIRRNNLCIYKGKGEFVTIPIAIELRAFYGIGDLAAGYTFAPNVKGQKEPVADAVGCLSQLVPVMDYLGNSSAGKDPGTEFIKAASPSALSPLVEWGFNSDWKGSHIERRGDFYDNIPAWQRAYKGTPESLKSINKFVNAQSNDVAKGNEYMLGNKFLDAITNPSAINHFFGGFGGGATTFAERSLGLASNKIKGHSVETKDIPFVRSFFYTPSEQSSMQRTKSKWYNYLDEMETTMENVKRLKSKNATPGEKLRNSADYYNFQNSDKSEKVNVIESAKRQMKRWRDLLKKSDDEESIKFANQNIDLIMQNAVDELDKLN